MTTARSPRNRKNPFAVTLIALFKNDQIIRIGNSRLIVHKLSDNNYAVLLRQLSILFKIPAVESRSYFKRLLGVEFIYSSVEIDGKKECVIRLDELPILIRNLGRDGNKIAINLQLILNRLALNQVFSDAFDDEFNKSDRLAVLIEEIPGKRRNLKLSILEWMNKNAVEGNVDELTAQVTDCILKKLWNLTATGVSYRLRIKPEQFYRHEMTCPQIEALEYAENLVITIIDFGESNPIDAAKQAKIDLSDVILT